MFDFQIKTSRRARRVRITVYPGGKVAVTLPWGMGKFWAEKIVKEKSAWIEAKVEEMKKIASSYGKKNLSRKEIQKLKAQALDLVSRKVAHFNQFYGFSVGKISIRNQKTRWGSCSKKGNLSFNCRLATLPEELADYVVVHELCHLGSFDHSRKFWFLVEKSLPDHRERRRKLRGR